MKAAAQMKTRAHTSGAYAEVPGPYQWPMRALLDYFTVLN